MGRKKTEKDREWFERQVAEMGEALNRLPADRQDALDALDGGKVADVMDPVPAPETNKTRGTVSESSIIKCNPSIGRAARAGRREEPN